MSIRQTKTFAGKAAIALGVAAFLFIPAVVFAQDAFGTEAVQGLNLAQGDLRTLVVRIINIALSFLGILAVLIVLYGGYTWMTAKGEPGQIDKAKAILRNGVIGLVIIFSSWAIATFVMNALFGAGQGTGGDLGGGGGSGAGVGDPLSGALGSGAIQYHLPSRNAVNVPRNTAIMITFKEAINASTIISGTEALQNSNVVITRRDGVALGSSDVRVTKTDDNKTFVLRPVQPLGSATESADYTVRLTSGVQKAAGGSAFSGLGYEWRFSVSTQMDTTPPQLVSVFPAPGARVARNAVVQLTFTEALDPLTVRGVGHVAVTDAAGAAIAGGWTLTNGYKTLEFVPSETCGANSCGTTLMCLPVGSGSEDNVRVTVRAPDIDAQNAPQAVRPANGITDVIGNAFDGDGDGRAEGPGADTRVIGFGTTASVQSTAPRLVSVLPQAGAENVQLDAPITFTFQPQLQASTVSNVTVRLRYQEQQLSYWTEMQSEQLPSGETQSTVELRHSVLRQNGSYQPEIDSTVRDVYQNCFAPAQGPDGGGGQCVTTAALPYCCFDATSGSVKPQATTCSMP